MKRIEVIGMILPDLDSVLTAHRSYRVYLGNKHTRYFNSKREAEAFQAEVNRFLNETLQDINLELSHAYSCYRLAWPLLLAQRMEVIGGIEGKMRDATDRADDALNRAIFNSHGPNGMHHAWKALSDAGGALSELFASLEKFYAYKNHGALRHQASFHERHCTEIVQQMDAFGKENDGAGA